MTKTVQRQGEDVAVWTIGEVAEYLRVSDRHVRRLTVEGDDRLPVVRVGASVRYRRADVMAWMDRQTQK